MDAEPRHLMAPAEGDPVMPIARPVLGEEEAAAARRAILSGWVSQGPEVLAFEAEFAACVGSPHACAVANGTAALFLALKAAGVAAGDEVVTVSHSHISTANSIRHLHATPVFVDVEPDTYNIDAAQIEAALTHRTRAILAVHQLGMPCDLGGVLAVGDRRGLPVVEDAACAIGSEIRMDGRWERIGRPHGALACFSFHPRKLLTTGEGGMIVTANPAWDANVRRWRNHAMHAASPVAFETYDEVGYNLRLSDIQAAVGREQLRRLPEILEVRRRQVAAYRERLAAIPGLAWPRQPEWARSNWQSLCVRLPESADRRAVMQSLQDAGIATRLGVTCAHREGAYADGSWRCGPQPTGLRESERAQDRGLMLPLYHSMTERDIDRVVDAVRSALSRASSRSG